MMKNPHYSHIPGNIEWQRIFSYFAELTLGLPGKGNMAYKKILIIDDEEDLCKLLKAYLTTLHYDVFTASTLGDAMRDVPQIIPDFIFLDNNLPDGLGWDKIDAIQAMVPDCSIILISAFKFIPENLRNKESVRLIEKPISFSLLRSYLE